MIREETHSVWQGRVRIRVLSKGRGPALVFFHGPWGLTWDPFLEDLAQSFSVVAPEHPGTTPAAPDDNAHLTSLRAGFGSPVESTIRKRTAASLSDNIRMSSSV